MNQAEPNSQSIQEQQKEQEMQQEPPQPSFQEAVQQSIEEEKQNDQQIENQEDLVDQQVENRAEANQDLNANNLQQEVQQEKEQAQEEREVSLQREVHNQIEAQPEPEEQIQNLQVGQAQQQQVQNQEPQIQAQIEQNPQIPQNQELQQVVVENKQIIPTQEQQIQNVVTQNEQKIQQNIQKQKQQNDLKTKQYIHKLERQLQSFAIQNELLRREMETLREAQSKLRQDYQTTKQTVMDLRKKKLETQFQKTKALKECDKLKKENEIQRKKIEQAEKIGDIIVLKNTLQELTVLTEAQQQEIQQLKSASFQPLIEELKQQITLLQDYQNTQKEQQNQIQKLKIQNKILLQQVSNLNNTNNQQRNQVQRLKLKQAQLDQQIILLNNSITDWQNKWREFQTERQSNARSRELQKKILDYESQKNIGNENEVIHLNILSDREQKDIILREYLILQGKFKQQQIEFQETKSKLRKLQRQQIRVHTSFIKKKEYIDLSIKYNKAKKCLQGAFQQLRLIKNDDSQLQNVQEQVNEMLQGTQARECQKLIKDTQSIVSALHDKIDNIQYKQSIMSSRREYESMQQTIKLLKSELSYNQNLLRMMTDDIKLKNTLIAEKNQIIDALRKRTVMMPSQTQNYKKTLKLSNEVASLRETLSVFETQNILLVKEISSLNSQVAHWKHLYNNVKDSLKLKINTSLQQKSSNGGTKVMGQQTFNICKQCEQRKLYLSSKQYQSNQSQTDNLNQFYYKQIKDILAFLNKVSKECEKVPQLSKELNHSINEIREKFISEFKEKYLRLQNHYSAKLNELKREKADNESWRVRAKEEIRQEFQDIRELVMNNRLANALRQAKNLIDSLEAQVQKQDEQNPQEEMEQQGQVEEKKDE